MTFRILFLLFAGFCAYAVYYPHSQAADAGDEDSPKTVVSIRQDKFYINGEITYASAADERVKGLLLNSRMVQGIFDDENPKTVALWNYPDTQTWSPDRNTDEFVAAMKSWHDHGLLAFTINLQGGSPTGYGNQRGWINSAFDADGNLKDAYVKRLEKILREADRLGMVVIIGLFYFGQDQNLKDEPAILRAVDTTIAKLHDLQYKNILVEIDNECDVKDYDHDILKPDRVHELILRAKGIERNGHRFLVGTSYAGGSIPRDNVLAVSDFVLMHGNGVSDPKRITQMVETVRNKLGERKIPILFNEDDHFNFDKEANNMDATIRAGASWGYFDYRMNGEKFEDGYQSVPVDWTINSERKRAFFQHVKQWTVEGTQKVAADKERITRTVRFLSEENHPRTATKENKEKTVDYITKSIADTGFEVTRSEFARKVFLCDVDFPASSPSRDHVAMEQFSFTFTNIHAMKKGKTNKRIVVGAHYDAVRESPGADDNASGVAVLIELAHLLKNAELNCDVELVSYDIEEYGCLGSQYHAKKLKAKNVDVVCMLDMDLVGYYSDKENSQDYPVSAMSLLYGTKGDFLAMIGRPEDAKLLTDATKAFQGASTLRILSLPAPKALEGLLSRSDHSSFWREGYPALFFTDTAEFRNKNYHKSTDTWDTLDYDRLAQVPVGLYEIILMIDAANAPK